MEEENNVNNVLKTLKLICNDTNCLYMYDKELATRTFVAPVIGKFIYQYNKKPSF